MPRYPQTSVRELITVFSFAGLGIAGLCAGNILAAIFMSVAFLALSALVIVAFVRRDLWQSFSIGFVIPVFVYSSVVMIAGDAEFDPYEGKLPSTKLVRPLFELVVKRQYTNLLTGEVIPDYDPTQPPSAPGLGVGGVGGFGGGFGGGGAGLLETPDRATFMSLAHVIIAMLLGYVGAKFGTCIHQPQSTGN